jgi:thioredoxin 1
MSNVQSADDNTFQTTVLEADKTVLVDFWAPWCGPCVRQTPVLEKFAASNDDVEVVKVNVDESPKVAARYGVRSIPTLTVFVKGEAVVGTMGLQNERSLEQLLAQARNGA